MYVVPLKQIPNQVFSVSLNNVDYRIALRSIQGLLYMSCWADGDLLFYNQLCTPNNWVNVYDYISVNGKFYFECLENNYPSYDRLGVSQRLLFLTPDEVEGIRNASA